MKIELKRISFYERMSEETNCFAADLYINGKKVGYVKNDGQGGCTNYYGCTKEDNQIIREAEAYCKTLPNIKYHGYDLTQNLELVIDMLFEEHITAKLNAKAQKKKERLMENAILVGVPDADSYSYYKFKVALSKIPTPQLQASIVRIKAKLNEGEVILNTNLAELGIKV